jgi:Na+-driven multidrug efflux pump
MPIAFGIGAPLVAMVGSNIGAGQAARAQRIALTGGLLAFCIAETMGLAAAIWPSVWMGLFGAQGQMLAAGVAYLQVVGPFYGFFALGFTLYFASQGAGRLKWPLLAALIRLIVVAGGGWLVLRYAPGSMHWFFAATALGMFSYGVLIVATIAGGAWSRPT